MNDIDSPKFGGGPPQLPSCGASASTAPPPPRLRVPDDHLTPSARIVAG